LPTTIVIARNLESKADEEQRDTHQQKRALLEVEPSDVRRDCREVRAGSCAVHQRDTVQQEGRGEGAEKEIFYRSFRRPLATAIHPD
jgi:hypothetical protein